MFGFSGGEILLIAFIALLLFGNEKLPENMKKMIKGLNQAKKVARDVQTSWQEVKDDVQRSINFEDESNQIKELIAASNVNTSIENINEPKISLDSNSVSQEELDLYYESSAYHHQHLLNEQSEVVDFSKDQVETEEYLKVINSKDYINSSDFVGPRI